MKTPRDKPVASVRGHGTSANTIRGGVRYDRDFKGRWFGYGFDLEHNGLQDLTLRLVPGGGIGWQLTLSDRYLSNPPPGFEKNDLLLTTGLKITLGELK